MLKGVCVCVGTFTLSTSLYKYTRVARGQDGVEVKRGMLHYMQDVRAVRGMG